MGASTATTVRKIDGYSDISERVLASASIIREVANTDVEGTVGYETVKVWVGELSAIDDYVPGTGVSITEDSSAYVDIDNKKEKGINEILDGYSVMTAPADYVATRLDAALRQMGETMDTDALAQMATDGTEEVAAGSDYPTIATIYADILGLKGKLDAAKAPRTDRKLIVQPAIENMLLHTDSKIVLNTQRGDNIQAEGYIGRLLGFDIYSTPLLPAATNMIAMQKRGFAFKEGWKGEPAIVSLDGSSKFYGDSAVKGRMAYVYGAVRSTLIQVHNGAAGK